MTIPIKSPVQGEPFLAPSRRATCLLLALVLAMFAAPANAQVPGPSVELGLTFNAQRSLQVGSSQNFWAQGGAAEIGVDAYRGFGIAADVQAVRTGSVGSTGTALSLVSETFGPRFRWHGGHRLSFYGEGLLGEANAFNSLFPSNFGAQPDANAFATQVGGGVDLRLHDHLAVRVLRASWLRTQFPNSGSDVQNNLLVGAGIVLRTR